MKYQTKKIVDAANVASDITSTEIDLRFNYGCVYQAKLTGAPSGDVILQGTNDEPSESSRAWSTIKTDTISGTNTIANNVDGLYWPFIRVFKAAGGTGTMTVTITIKGA